MGTMISHGLAWGAGDVFLQNVLVRSFLALMTALLLVWGLGPFMIARLRRAQIGQMVRNDGPKTHLDKSGTPTMGGLLVLLAMTVAILLWGELASQLVWMVVAAIWLNALIGFVDDYQQLILKRSKGLSAKAKFIGQSVVGIILAVVYFYSTKQPNHTELWIPFFKHWVIPLGGLSMVLTYLVVVGSSNAVNLTDGLDGLAIFIMVLVVAALGALAVLSGHALWSQHLGLPHVPGAGELMVVAAALVGAGLGFLWFNAYPAQVFMGDVGSLGLGAGIGMMAVVLRQELLLCIMGGIFIAETVSVILQVVSYRLRKKRIFRMAPLHHHFELKGWSEPQVVVRFWLITVILVIIGLSVLLWH